MEYGVGMPVKRTSYWLFASGTQETKEGGPTT